MAYEKQNFEEGQVQKAEHLNHIEDGIHTVEENTVAAIETLTAAIPQIIYSETEPEGAPGIIWLKPVNTET